MNKKSNDTLVSVIIPVYNVEKYLCECIDSVICQTYKNIEIILIDDGSTDNSRIICDEYEKKDSRINVIHKINEGLGLTRNCGLGLANGKYVYFLDSDDYIKNDEIEYLVAKMDFYGADVLYEGYYQVNDNHQIFRKINYTECEYIGNEIKEKLVPKMFGEFPGNNDKIYMSSSAQMYSMEIIKSYSLKFVSEREFVSEDFNFNLVFLEHATKAVTLNRIGNYYRYNIESLSHKYDETKYIKCRKMFEDIRYYIEYKGLSQETTIRWSNTFFRNSAAAIMQEVGIISLKNFFEQVRKIRNICNDKFLIDAIDNYPINRDNIKNRLLLSLIKYKLIITLIVMFLIVKKLKIRG